MARVFLLLGGNIGDVTATFEAVASALIELDISITNKSSVYSSPAWGYASTNVFYNQVFEFQTSLTPGILLDQLLDIEKQLGRMRQSEGYSDRTIDLDILFYNDNIVSTEKLEIPHPRLHLRRFTLVPLVEIDPAFIHPVLKTSLKDLLEICTDSNEVEKI